ncbi:beta-N-acetylhexosaminidase [Parvularcula sp. IMCC14364]|uniref:beta-N-acetylhexosaminidase n=1 Tax=Parvularcula sp. IMCC14364 TaxID=3067902 RepID=UPI002740BF7C|nr:beta-N-acetylhexosaminidase [Parvularcula sp. IMCC14364]
MSQTQIANSDRRAVIYGCSGEYLTDEEAAFFRRHQPWGFILFARNCQSSEQIRNLCDALREAVGDDRAPIMIDQEGGRVARLKPPLASARPPMDRFGALMKLDPARARQAAFLGARLLAEDVRNVGVNVNCVPCLDLPQPDADQIIGDRALALHTDQISELGKEVLDGTLAGGVLPIIKHIPGHGRAMADSHLELPVVTATRDDLEQTDFLPFRNLSSAPMAMTAHVVFTAYDADHPATLSPRVIDEVIRGFIGFDGLLMTDDLSMKALDGTFQVRSQAALAAGCDMLLHCNGNMDEMQAVADVAPVLAGKAQGRAQAALDQLAAPRTFEKATEEQRFAELLKPVMA